MNSSQAIKHIIDVLVAASILVLSLPVLALVALSILVLEGRPVIYVSRRQVSVDRTIPVYKFRTMVRDATSRKYRLKERFMRDGYLDIPRGCEVYTPIGRVLERLQIVELPQMVNVLFHGMSLIGNRPLPSENVQLLRKFDRSDGALRQPRGDHGHRPGRRPAGADARSRGWSWSAPTRRCTGKATSSGATSRILLLHAAT